MWSALALDTHCHAQINTFHSFHQLIVHNPQLVRQVCQSREHNVLMCWNFRPTQQLSLYKHFSIIFSELLYGIICVWVYFFFWQGIGVKRIQSWAWLTGHLACERVPEVLLRMPYSWCSRDTLWIHLIPGEWPNSCTVCVCVWWST